MELARLKMILDAAAGAPVLCIGDVMLDRFVRGEVSRISPEAPVPVLRRTSEMAMPGGAGNVARNLATLGLVVELAGVIGADSDGAALKAELSALGIGSEGLIISARRPTTLKTRFVSGGQQLLRVDAEDTGAITPDEEAALISALQQQGRGARFILMCDYAKGALTHAVIAATHGLAGKTGAKIVTDPKGRDFARYGAVDLLKPNAGELAAAMNMPAGSDAEIGAAISAARMAWPAKAIVVTRAARGMSYSAPDGAIIHRPGKAREVYDVSGAGDTSLAALAAGLAGGASMDEAVTLALAASGIAVGKAGTATVSRGELESMLRDDGQLTGGTHMPLEALMARLAAWRDEGLTVGFTNGCFDILHPGHLKVIEEAKAACGRLIVGLNSDASVKRLKGPSRPINDVTARARVLSALSAVDAVVVFEEDTPEALIRALQPDLLVKGGDYTADAVAGADVVKARGGRVLIVPTVEGHSTTATIARSQKN